MLYVQTGAKSGHTVISLKDQRYHRNIGQRVDLSYIDVKVINMAYCQGNSTAAIVCNDRFYACHALLGLSLR